MKKTRDKLHGCGSQSIWKKNTDGTSWKYVITKVRVERRSFKILLREKMMNHSAETGMDSQADLVIRRSRQPFSSFIFFQTLCNNTAFSI